MGRAVRKRQRGQSRYLAKIAATHPALFAEKWDRRIDSWLLEIKLSVAEWKRGGNAATERVFNIVDAAMATLAACGTTAYEQHARHTYDTLCSECCTGAAEILDPHLYQLSNYDSFKFKSKKGRDGYSLAFKNAETRQ
jgi:hypothetical protein